MSEFSREVKHVVDNSIVKEMTSTMDAILKREPYSVDYRKLTKDKTKLSKLSLIYDFLEEYIDGNEEMQYQNLWDIVRLTGPMILEPSPIDYQARLNTYPSLASNFTIFVDGVQWIFNGEIEYGYRSFYVRYNGVCESVRLIHDQKMVGSMGNKVGFHNVFIDLPGEFEFRVYDLNNVLITTSLIKYTVTDMPAYCHYNALDTCGLPVTLFFS